MVGRMLLLQIILGSEIYVLQNCCDNYQFATWGTSARVTEDFMVNKVDFAHTFMVVGVRSNLGSMKPSEFTLSAYTW